MRKRYSRSYTVLSFLTMFSYREQPSGRSLFAFTPSPPLPINLPAAPFASGKEKAAIMNAINKEAGPATRAGAISFSLPVSDVAGLRRLNEE